MRPKLLHLSPIVGILFSCAPEAPCEPARRGETMLDPEFVRIEPGSFLMGALSSDFWEWPPIAVTLTRPYWIQTSEVTFGEYRRVMEAAKSQFEYPDTYESQPPYPRDKRWFPHWSYDARFAMQYLNARSMLEGMAPCYDDSRCTLEYIRSNDEGFFWFNEEDRTNTNEAELGRCYETIEARNDCNGYRLPSEAEWFHAARAGSASLYLCGNRSDCMDDYAWHLEHPDAPNGWPLASHVGMLCPNAFGLYDVYGNQAEITSDVWYDLYAPYSYADSVVDPVRPFPDTYFDIDLGVVLVATGERHAQFLRLGVGANGHARRDELYAFRTYHPCAGCSFGFRSVRTIFEE